jgi:hypothetical protein
MQEAYLFIVRLWPAEGPRADFRATLQRAGTDESAWFTQADALVRCFERFAGSPRDADDHPPTEMEQP